MRNLARRGLNVYCVEWYREQPCFRSVYGQSFECPNPDDHPAEWLRFMIEFSRKLGGRPALIPSADQFVSAIGRHSAELEEYFLFCQNAAAVQALLATKQRQYELAGKCGLPVPRTQFVRSLEEMEDFARSARFPCLFKPLHARDWEKLPAGHPFGGTKLAVANSAVELLAQYRLIVDINPEIVVQEVIEGPDTAKLVYLSCYARDGRRIAACVVKEIRTEPINFGSASLVVPATDLETDSLCDQFLRKVGYAGICEIEVKRDSRDGQVKMIEANPRYSVTADAAPYAGVNIGWLHYLDLIGQPVVEVRQDGRDFRHIVLIRDFSTIRSYRAAGLLTWWELIYSYRPRVAFFDFDLRDWRVTAETIDRLLRLMFGPMLRKLLPRRGRPGLE